MAERIFASDTTDRRVVFPWKRTATMCWANVCNRRGRFTLTLVCVAVMVAFLMNSMTYHGLVDRLAEREDTHTRAVLQRSGALSADADAARKQAHQRAWILVLSSVLCITGITNTMLMSVTERSGEIGTLKCLGSLNSYVVRLFLLEALLVGLIGSLGGTVLGWLLGLLQLGLSLEFGLIGLSLATAPWAGDAWIALAAGTVLTVLAAAYPTWIAAHMSPVEAMRVEV